VTDGPGPAPVPALAVLVDFDGTIATADLSDEVMRRHAELDAWAPLERAYLEGRIGSRELLTRQAALLDNREGAIEATGRGEGHDPTFVAFARSLLARGVAVEVVSDGFGFFVKPALRAMGLADLPIFTASTTFDDGRVAIDFPNGHPRCFVCGTCKRERILVHRRAGRHVVFVGDGYSDLYAAAHADTVFAKDHLAELCREHGLPFRDWVDFADVMASIDADVAAGRYAAAGSTEFRCGPEVWPEGTTRPIWGNGLTPRAMADRSGPA
jgi:2-hydroxy-3-keto-5-methylthiopentenyl-1-phosphate phosphatase